jgi:uncharacterized protein YjdB
MSKIVCDVCGSTYSETEAQCPICGTAKSEAAKPVIEANGEDQASKGGKFSKTNTRKTGAGNTRKSGSENNKSGEEGAPSNVAMIVIVAVLLLAIVAVCVFIAVRLFGQPENPNPSTNSTQSTSQTIPCTGIELLDSANQTLTFTDLTQTAQLSVKALPENTTDTVVCTYTSSDPAVVLVNETGLVTPVASGNATITIAYGTYSISVSVTCDIPKPITEIKLVGKEITLSRTSKTAQLYTGELDPSDIKWESNDETIAYVENGLVTAVANGKVTITATYGDLTATCTVHVRDMDATEYMFAHRWDEDGDEDFESTLTIGESLEIKFIDSATKEVIKITEWKQSGDFPKCCTLEYTEDGVKITATATTYSEDISGNYVAIHVSYEGKAYTYKIRVSKPAETQE